MSSAGFNWTEPQSCEATLDLPQLVGGSEGTPEMSHCRGFSRMSIVQKFESMMNNRLFPTNCPHSLINPLQCASQCARGDGEGFLLRIIC